MWPDSGGGGVGRDLGRSSDSLPTSEKTSMFIKSLLSGRSSDRLRSTNISNFQIKNKT